MHLEYVCYKKNKEMEKSSLKMEGGRYGLLGAYEKGKIFIESVPLSMYNTITNKCEETVMSF